MSDKIILSEKHGVNPSIPVCFWCGKQKNEIALLGKLEGDIEAPKNLVFDYEPCDKCKEIFDKGVLVIEVTDEQPANNSLPISKDNEGIPLYPTGSHCVVRTRVMNRIFERAEPFEDGSRITTDEETYSQLFREKGE